MSFAKPRRAIGDPISDAKPDPHFEPLPTPSGVDFVLPLTAVLPDSSTQAGQDGHLVFHVVGDTGGIHGTDVQGAISDAMEAQITHGAANAKPMFCYHVGDVVYYNGLSTDYVPQFYEPYQHYPAPIFAIPGNHDGDTGVRRGDPADDETSLYGFMKNFCSASPHADFAYRETMTQPYCYWTLQAPFAHIIGLYSNVDGQLDGRRTVQQKAWLQQQITATPRDKWLIVAVHHPCYSLDSAHGGYPEILAALDDAAKGAGRMPDVVLSGHVHNYQRFSRAIAGGAQVPYIVAGAGGYANTPRLMHRMQTGGDFSHLPFQTTQPDVKLEAFNTSEPGFLRITAGPGAISFEYFLVPFDGSAPPAAPFDSLTLHPHTPKTL